MAKKETAKTVEKTVNTGFIDNVEALEAKMKEMREAQKVFATFTPVQVPCSLMYGGNGSRSY